MIDSSYAALGLWVIALSVAYFFLKSWGISMDQHRRVFYKGC